MIGRLLRTQVTHALVVCTLLAAILFGFVLVWSNTNATLTGPFPSWLEASYGYLTNSEQTSPTELSSSDFQRAPFNEAPARFGLLDMWFQLEFKNTSDSPQTFILVMDNPMSDALNVYQLDESGALIAVEMLGDRIPDLPQTQHILPHLSLTLNAEEQTTLRIRFQTTGAPFLPFLVLSESDFQQYEMHLHLIWGTFVGIILLMMAYNLVLYLGVNDRAYILYIGYVVSMLLLLGVVHGYGHYLFPTALQLWLSSKIIAINSAAAYFTLQFAIHFLRFSHDDGRIYRFSQAFSSCILGFGLFAVFAPEYIAAPLFSVLQVSAYVLVGRLIYLRLKHSFRWAKYYVISWIPFFIGAAIGYLIFVGAIDYSFYARHALMFAVIFEMVFISMALADRLGDTERRRLHQATHDFKLNLANEALLEEAIKQRASRYHRNGFSVITAEISNYDSVIPYVQETHLKQLISSLGQNLVNVIEPAVKLVELDADDKTFGFFALIRGEQLGFLVETNNPVRLETLLKDLSNADNFNPMQDTIPYRIQCVFGAAVHSTFLEEPVELINQARQAVNLAIQNNQPYQIYDPDQTQVVERKVRLAQDLGNAIRHDTLQLFHQPQIMLNDQQVRSSEAVLRWEHPAFGTISPVEFVEIAEETGLIKHLTRWVLNKAFEQATQLIAVGETDFNMSINISAKDFSRTGFVSDVEKLLKKHEIAAEHFTLEITETSDLKDAKVFKNSFIKLQQLGFQFAMDDFGTGYSSLMYANEHPFTELKIDRSFINDLLLSNKLMAIVSATVSMAKELDLVIAAEGVEDKQTLNALKTMGCDKIQGYYISKPMPFEDYINWHPQTVETIIGVGETLSMDFKQVSPNN